MKQNIKYPNINCIEDIEQLLKTSEIMLLRFDNTKSNYDEYIDTLHFKVINITDKEIIDFYEIDVLPTILVYKNKNLMDSIKGFHTKTNLVQKILNIIQN
jgi:hypothetical protein